MRRFGEPVDPARRYRTRPGAYGIILRGRDMLLTEQSGSTRELQLPGGGMDPGEGATRALARECLEETGWTVRVDRHIGTYQRYCYMPEYDLWARKVCHIYLCRPGPRRGIPSDAAHRALWMPVSQAASALSNEGDRFFTDRILSGVA